MDCNSTAKRTNIVVRINLARGGHRDNFQLSVDLQLPGHGITAIFGHSGSGKTTLLRCIAGLEQAPQGKVVINDDVWQDGDYCLPTHQRSLGYVFQEASLFSHLTVKANLNYGIKRSRIAVESSFFNQVVDVLAISNLLTRYDHQLSGGERQRVAIARALLTQPRLLLMDEPLAALDRQLKHEILPYLERIRAEFSLPIIYVSHSQEEVSRLADHVVVLERGQVIAQGELNQVFSNIAIAHHDGADAGVMVQGLVTERDSEWHLARVAISGGELWLRDLGYANGQQIRAHILAKDVSLALSCQHDSSIVNKLLATVVEIEPDRDDAMLLIRLLVGEDFLLSRITRRSAQQLSLTCGQSVWAQIKSVAIVN